VGDVTHDGVGHLLAHGVGVRVTVLLEDVAAAADGAALLAGAPDALADGARRALHAVGDDLPGAAHHLAGAGGEGAGVRQAAGLLHHRAGHALLHRLPAARLHDDLLLLPDRLAAVRLVRAGPRLGHRLVARLRHLDGMLLVDRLAGDRLHRHLVLLHH